MALQRLDNRAARALFLDRHALAEQPAGPARDAHLQGLIRRLGFVQLDSINTVARAHDMILFSRRPTYRPANLKRLYERDRALFEHWTHDAAVIPMDFYHHWHLRFQRDAELSRARWKSWRRGAFEQKFETVLRHIRDHGPVSSSDVGKDERKGSGGWWDWHPSKTALEYLWGIVSMRGGEPFHWLNPAMLLLLLLMVDLPQYLSRDHTVILRAAWPIRGGYYAAILLLLVIMGGTVGEPFIYFQF